MDVATAISLASAAAGGAATAAGQSAWQSLVTLARNTVGLGPGSAGPPDTVDPADGDAVRVLTGRIADRAQRDAGFAEELCRWAEEHRAALQMDQTQVHNTVSGSARIDGPVIQARDIHGGINLG